MEGSESEAVFKSLINLDPQIFINETLNTVDDLLDEAFQFYHQEASTLLKSEGTNRSQYLTQGINDIRNMIQADLDARLGMWEKYCLHHCFVVPKGFSLPKESVDETLTCQDVLCDPDLDAQLDTLRDRLAIIGKESAELNRELQALERQSASRDHCAELVSEAVQLHEQNSAQDMFKDMVTTVSELRTKMNTLRTRKVENMESKRTKRINDPNRELPASNCSMGLYNAALEDLQEFIADLKQI